MSDTQTFEERDLPNVVQGDDIPFTIEWTDANGDPVDITGWTFWITIKESHEDSDADAIVQQTKSSFSSPLEGRANITIDGAETKDESGSKVYDMQVKKGTGGTLTTFLRGNVYIEPEVTEATA